MFLACASKLVIHKKRDFCLCVYCNRKAVEGQNDRGEEEEKRETGSRNSVIIICFITYCRERGTGGILLTNRRNSGFYVVSGALDLSCISINHKMIC